MKYSSEAEDRIKEECCPEKPFIVFRTEDSISVYLCSPQRCNATFGINLPVYDGDVVAKMKRRMRRNDKLIKGI